MRLLNNSSLAFLSCLFIALAFAGIDRPHVRQLLVIQKGLWHSQGLTFIDSTVVPDGQIVNYWKHEAHRTHALYRVFYSGKGQQLIPLSTETVSRFTNGNDNFPYPPQPRCKKPAPGTLSIVVDTATKLVCAFRHERYKYNDRTKEWQNLPDTTEYYHTYPLIIRNLSDSLVFIGSHNKIWCARREAKAASGEWVAVEEHPFPEFCGTGARRIFLAAGQVLIAKVFRYSGGQRVICRLKFSLGGPPIYSNAFYDYIDPNQFIPLPPDSTTLY